MGVDGAASAWECTVYRWQPARTTFPPDSPHYGVSRFCDGSFPVLYVAESAAAAIAEFLRRHRELLHLQHFLTVEMFELDVVVAGELLDALDDLVLDGLGFDRSRLASSESEEEVRYTECQQLARSSRQEGMVGIQYPSAAALWDAWNLVLFDGQSKGGWICTAHSSIEVPKIDPDRVRILETH